MSGMYACQPFVNSSEAVSSLPTCMYKMANLVAPVQQSDTNAGAASIIDACRLERLRGDLFTLARICGILPPTAAAPAAASTSASTNKPATASAAVVNSGIKQATNTAGAAKKPSVPSHPPALASASSFTPATPPVSLSLQCSPSRPPIAVLLLVEVLRTQRGVPVYLDTHGRVTNGVVSSPSPSVARLISRLRQANPDRRMSAKICLDLVWSESVAVNYGNDCCLIDNAFSGQPILGEVLALRLINLVADGKALPTADQLLDLSDQLQTGRRVSDQRMAELLSQSDNPKQTSLGQLLAWSVLTSAAASTINNAGLNAAVAKFSNSLNSSQPFASFCRDLVK